MPTDHAPPDAPRRPRWNRRAAIATALLLAAAGLALGVWHARFRTYHFAEVHPGILYRDGIRSASEFATACRKSSARTVVMLVDDAEEAEEDGFGHGADYCQRNGIKLVRIIVPVSGTVKTPRVREFLDVMSEPANHPVLVQCSDGIRRTGMMVAAYQRSVLGYDAEQAARSILAFGHSPRATEGVRSFIECYEPATRTVTIPLRRGESEVPDDSVAGSAGTP